jgi:hypothetical protein
MTGFIGALFGLFGGKKASNQPTPKPAASRKGEAYFLDSDSAKSLGNMDYMRTAKSIKRSFPTAVGKLNMIKGEIEDSISSMEKRANTVMAKTVSSTPSFSSSPSSSYSTSTFENKSTFQPTSTTPRRSADSNMDMFRNMARDMKKKK